MKIAATADIHADLEAQLLPGEMERFVASVFAEAPDVFIIAGDIAGLGKKKRTPFLRSFDGLEAAKLIVPGNHDLWFPEGDSWAHYAAMRDEFAESGWHMLDGAPMTFGNVAIVGSAGWYDYTLADPRLELPHDSDYAAKRWCGRVIWNDGIFVRLGRTDKEFCAGLLRRLEEDIDSVEAQVDTIVAVTHVIGFEEMLTSKPDIPTWVFCNAYMGSTQLGALLLRHPKVSYHLCGHTHEARVVRKGHLTSINVGSTYARKRLEVLTV
jgi:3',5'-cyclic AMP phosphodiesterase CpdA